MSETKTTETKTEPDTSTTTEKTTETHTTETTEPAGGSDKK